MEALIAEAAGRDRADARNGYLSVGFAAMIAAVGAGIYPTMQKAAQAMVHTDRGTGLWQRKPQL